MAEKFKPKYTRVAQLKTATDFEKYLEAARLVDRHRAFRGELAAQLFGVVDWLSARRFGSEAGRQQTEAEDSEEQKSRAAPGDKGMDCRVVESAVGEVQGNAGHVEFRFREINDMRRIELRIGLAKRLSGRHAPARVLRERRCDEGGQVRAANELVERGLVGDIDAKKEQSFAGDF